MMPGIELKVLFDRRGSLGTRRTQQNHETIRAVMLSMLNFSIL